MALYSGGSIRAFGVGVENERMLNDGEEEIYRLEINPLLPSYSASSTPPNNSLHLTGLSGSFIEKLSHDAVVVRQVNSGVRFLLNSLAQNI